MQSCDRWPTSTNLTSWRSCLVTVKTFKFDYLECYDFLFSLPFSCTTAVLYGSTVLWILYNMVPPTSARRIYGIFVASETKFGYFENNSPDAHTKPKDFHCMFHFVSIFSFHYFGIWPTLTQTYKTHTQQAAVHRVDANVRQELLLYYQILA